MKNIGLLLVSLCIGIHAMERYELSTFSAPHETKYQAQCEECLRIFTEVDAALITRLKLHYKNEHNRYISIEERKKMIVPPLTVVHYIGMCQKQGCHQKIKIRGYHHCHKKAAQSHTKNHHPGSKVAFKFIRVNLRGFINPKN